MENPTEYIKSEVTPDNLRKAPELDLKKDEIVELMQRETEFLTQQSRLAQEFLIRYPVEQAVPESELQKLDFEKFVKAGMGELCISETEIQAEYHFMTGLGAGGVEERPVPTFTPEERRNLETRCLLRIFGHVQAVAARELEALAIRLLAEYPSKAEAEEEFREKYKDFIHSDTQERLIGLKEKVKEAEQARDAEKEKIENEVGKGRTVLDVIIGTVSGSDKEKLERLQRAQAEYENASHSMASREQEIYELDNAQNRLRFMLYKGVLNENIQRMAMGASEGNEQSKQLAQAQNSEIFEKFLLPERARVAASEELAPTLDHFSEVLDSTFATKAIQEIAGLGEYVLANQDQNEVKDYIIKKAGDGMKMVANLLGGKDGMVRYITDGYVAMQEGALLSYKTTPEQVERKKREIAEKLGTLQAKLNTPENSNTLMRMKAITKALGEFQNGAAVESVPLSEVVKDPESRLFTPEELGRPCGDVLHTLQRDYQKLVDEYIDQTAVLQKEFLMEQYLGVHSTEGIFGADSSLRAKISNLTGGRDMLREGRYWMPFGTELGLDEVALKDHAERLKDFQNRMEEANPDCAFERFNTETQEVEMVNKKWKELSAEEQELVMVRDCPPEGATAEIGSGWKEGFFADKPFLSFSAQFLVADVMISNTPRLAKLGYCMAKIGAKTILMPLSVLKAPLGLYRLSRKVLAKGALKAGAKEALRIISPEITLGLSRVFSKVVTEKVLRKVEVLVAKTAAKLGIKAGVATGANAVPLAGQVVSAGLFLWTAYDGYEIADYLLRSSRVSRAAQEGEEQGISGIEFDTATEQGLEDYFAANDISKPTEEQQTAALNSLSNAHMKLTYPDGKVMEYNLQNGEVMSVKLTSKGEATELAMSEMGHAEDALERLAPPQGEGLDRQDPYVLQKLKLMAGWSQMDIRPLDSQRLAVRRFDGKEGLTVQRVEGDKWAIVEIPDVTFADVAQAVAMANLTNKVSQIMKANELVSGSPEPFYVSGGSVSFDKDNTPFNLEILEAGGGSWAEWYQQNLGISPEMIALTLNTAYKSWSGPKL